MRYYTSTYCKIQCLLGSLPACFLFLCILLLTNRIDAQVYKLAELNTEQILALNSEKTVVLIPGGILEEHGPYLPSFTDGYYNEHLTDQLAKAITARPGWNALVFPTIPLGSGGANELGQKFSFPGTYAVRPATLRAVFMDLASEFGEQGFQWIFVIHAHGSPDHSRALDEAGDYFRAVYGGHMIHLWGLMIDDTNRNAMIEAAIGKEGIAANGFDIHAGVSETSRTMYLHPELVASEITNARAVTARGMADINSLAKSEDWPGYFGSPAYASAALGEKLLQNSDSLLIKMANDILDGKDEKKFQRYADFMYSFSEARAIQEHSRKHEEKRRRQQQEWLTKKDSLKN
jgi:creatinine amidohydrolase/Fe(II)-dependent formamide hydrolase-like protein